MTPAKKASNFRHYHQLKTAGKCTACKHADAVPGKVRCAPCEKAHVARELQRQNRLKDIHRELGTCYYCDGNNEAMPGTIVCGYCQEQRSEWMQAFRQRRADAGLCIACGEPSPDGKRRCPSCREKIRAYRARQEAA